MKDSVENLTILKKLGFVLDQHGYYSNSDGWGFLLEKMPNFKILLSRLKKSHYNDGYDDCYEQKSRRYGLPLDR